MPAFLEQPAYGPGGPDGNGSPDTLLCLIWVTPELAPYPVQGASVGS
ncbi:hypothetical protein QF035_008939 [Streptomyces umbrinus]|uniref:Uncharacterized protein n=1 Tax=Streptomyces umbrinus TaxID=67370 RepID=A0ABU0T703_9ACTN|nr:hypothetical protein [Streptomyces umbrinus]